MTRVALGALALLVCVGSIGCGSPQRRRDSSPVREPSDPPRKTRAPERAPSTSGPLKRDSSVGDDERGKASWYGDRHHGKRTANGERFDMNALTAAHKRLPFGTIVRVENLANGKSVTVRINDRGPYARGRVIDLSKAAAAELDMLRAGIVPVAIRIVSRPAPR